MTALRRPWSRSCLLLPSRYVSAQSGDVSTGGPRFFTYLPRLRRMKLGTAATKPEETTDHVRGPWARDQVVRDPDVRVDINVGDEPVAMRG